MKRIPVSGPWITEKEVEYVADAVRTAWYDGANCYHDRFEKAFAEYLGVRYAVALPSCTSAIHLSLLALDVGAGDEVIVPDCTWIASAAPVTYVGATPVFADIDRHTWCLSADAVEACLSPRTKAVIAVDLYGGMPDMGALRALAQRRGFALIEDAAEAIGAEWHEQKAGSFGEAGVFSFHGSKILTTGEGGMLVTDREDIHRRVLCLRDHGRPPGDRLFYNTEVGYKYKMSSMQAALGLAQLERIDELVVCKRQIFGWYRDRLRRIPRITFNAEPEGTKNVYWMVTAILDAGLGLEKADLMTRFQNLGIDTRPFFHPLSSLPAYAASAEVAKAKARNKVSYEISPYGINLPSAMNLAEEQVDGVCRALATIIEEQPS